MWVDPHLQRRSPSMGMMLKALPAFQAAGFSISAWCFRADSELEGIRVTKLPCPAFLGRLELLWFTVMANGYAVWWRWKRRGAPADLVHCTGANFIGADLVSIHFVNAAWLKIQDRLPLDGMQGVAQRLLSAAGAVFEHFQFRSSARVFHAVSQSIAAEVADRARPPADVRVIPTPVNAANFSPAKRASSRGSSREAFGFAEKDVVFAFVSQGAYRRKGLWLALDIIQELRRAGVPAKFLVIGGTEPVVQQLRDQIACRHADAGAWIVQAGYVADLADGLAAADAFLFPSYFEGFAAVEVQAAALGLPLFLTRHCGSEMILEEGRNGWLISYDAKEAAQKIQSVLSQLGTPREVFLKGSISEQEWIEQMLRLCQEIAATKRLTKNFP